MQGGRIHRFPLIWHIKRCRVQDSKTSNPLSFPLSLPLWFREAPPLLTPFLSVPLFITSFRQKHYSSLANYLLPQLLSKQRVVCLSLRYVHTQLRAQIHTCPSRQGINKHTHLIGTYKRQRSQRRSREAQAKNLAGKCGDQLDRYMIM